MTKTKLFLILTGYQLTWLACIFGEKNYSEPLIGFFTGLIFLLIYFTYIKNKKKFIYIILSIAIPGYLFDSILVYISIYEFISTMKIGLLPIWMLVLWLSFATLFVEILVFFKNYKLIGIILSAFLGPFTYLLIELRPFGNLDFSILSKKFHCTGDFSLLFASIPSPMAKQKANK